MKMELNKYIYCAKHGHDWVIHKGMLWDKAQCATCGYTIRSMFIRKSDLPNWRKNNPLKNEK